MKAIAVLMLLGLAGCSAPTSTPVKASQPIAAQEPVGAYMIVQGKDYLAEDLGPYAASLPPIYAKYGGRYVAFSTDYKTVEGQSDYSATIISAWPSADAAHAFWNSAEYAEAKKLRDGVGTFDVIIVPALPPRP